MKTVIAIPLVACLIHVVCGCQRSVPVPKQPATQPASQPADAPVVDSITRYRCGKRVADVLTWYGESAVTIYDEDQTFGDPGSRSESRAPYRVSFFDDSDHGWIVIDAAWSPSGTYFAMKLDNAGGHQPYRTPVKIFKFGDRKLIDAEDIILKIRGISNIAVSHMEEPYIKWLSDTKLQVSVMSHFKESDSGMYVIDMTTLKATRPAKPPTTSAANNTK